MSSYRNVCPPSIPLRSVHVPLPLIHSPSLPLSCSLPLTPVHPPLTCSHSLTPVYPPPSPVHPPVTPIYSLTHSPLARSHPSPVNPSLPLPQPHPINHPTPVHPSPPLPQPQPINHPSPPLPPCVTYSPCLTPHLFVQRFVHVGEVVWSKLQKGLHLWTWHLLQNEAIVWTEKNNKRTMKPKNQTRRACQSSWSWYAMKNVCVNFFYRIDSLDRDWRSRQHLISLPETIFWRFAFQRQYSLAFRRTQNFVAMLGCS